MRNHILRAAVLLLIIGSCLFGMAGCSVSSGKGEVGMSGDIARSRHYEAEGYTFVDSREIVCWGDSMTEGTGASYALIKTDALQYDASNKSYPEILQELTHIRTFNFGVAGASSIEIAAMQGAAKREDISEESGFYDENLSGLGRAHLGDILVLEMGSNGGWDNDYEELIAQYEAMLKHANCTDFLILGDTDDPGTSLGDFEQWSFGAGEGESETQWEKALREHFGDHFVNVRQFLVMHGLEVAGLHAGEEDEELASRGCVSPQLRSDWTHLNSYGYYAKALAVYEQGKRLGYWT